jgi:hypothetical protein
VFQAEAAAREVGLSLEEARSDSTLAVAASSEWGCRRPFR